MRSTYWAITVLVVAGIAAADQPSIDAVTKMLTERPAGLGRPITDRPAWEKLAKVKSYRGVIRDAEAVLKRSIPDSPDALYLEFSRTGNRTRWQRVASRRRGRIGPLVLAECLENKRRFLPALAKTVDALCAERTWVMPAHDRGLTNFNGKAIDIDLGSSHLALNLAMAEYLLGDRLDAKTRKLIRDNVRRRIFEPYLAMVAGKRKKNWWMSGTNNWNAVCLAGVTGSALTLIESPRQRAVFVTAACTYSKNFLAGFTADGYCSEGVGYWGYGFGNYLVLAESIRQATRGKLDLMDQPSVRRPAMYARRIEIVGGVCPAFADCGVTARPSPILMQFISRRYALGAKPANDAVMVSPGGSLYAAMMYSFPNAATAAAESDKPAPEIGLRTWFDRAGVLICRGAKGTASLFGVAMKGGHNAEHHNHNDVGSYVVVVGSRPVLVDPGAEVYTARTFSRRRYDSKVLNSLGHPVPRVAGQLQRTGRKAAGRVVRTEFTDETDTLVLDLRAAYAVKELKTLQRTFVYSRKPAGSLTVTDQVEFTGPQAFETALITLGKWKTLTPKSLLVTDSGGSVRVDITAAGGELDIRAESIREDVRTKTLPTRLALALKKPITRATITMKITPTMIMVKPRIIIQDEEELK